MRVRQIQAGPGFLAYDAPFSVRFPETGMVLVTGANGEGKSGLIDIVTTAIYDETLRGTPPWRSGEASSVGASVDELVVERRITAGGTRRLSWRQRDGVSADHLTASKAQAALLALVPSWDVWRRSAVFNGQDAARFSAATDAERKRFLESILGLERFDRALAAARADLNTARTRETVAEGQLRSAQTIWERDTQASLDAESALDAAEDEALCDYSREDVTRMEHQRAQMGAQVSAHRTNLDRLRMAVARRGAEVELATQQQARFADGRCPTCGQPIPVAEIVRPVRPLIEVLNEVVVEPVDPATQALAQAVLQTELQTLQEASRALDQSIGAARTALAVAEAAERRRARAIQIRDDVQARLEQTGASVTSARQQLDAAQLDVRELGVVVEVLGLRGVRATLLGRSLAGLEAITNVVLGQLSDGELQLRLRSTTEQASGRIVDVLSIEVEGAGGGYGYRAASAGQQRRLDIALLLGLAEMADAAAGRPSGTLWFDEVFDGLDEDGIAGLGDVLVKLAASRAVVVISHHAGLIAHLRPRAVQRIHLQDRHVEVY